MLAKIKKSLLSFFSLNRKTAPVLLFFIFLGIFLPFYFTEAFIETLAGAIAGYLVLKVVLVPLLISVAFIGIAGLFLTYVTGPGFLDISYTVNPFVTLGWTLTRDLANMFFILVLVVIALATILRIGDYQAKKALPLLIIIALLINFTPVIAGVIIDFFNILMRFFLGEGLGIGSLLTGIRTLSAGIISTFQEWDPLAAIGTFAAIALAPIIIIIFNVITGVIFLILAFLFIMRPIALMMLVILSPIAFLCYILPATRSYWDQWWKQFIAWCLVGVTASFFLYLTNQLAYMVIHENLGNLWEGAAGGGAGAVENEGGVLIAFIPILIILGFLAMGFVAAITTSAAGASHIISSGRKVGKWAGTALAVKAGVIAARKYPKYAHRISEGAEKLSKGLESRGKLGQAIAKPFRWTERQAESLALHGEGVTIKDEQKWEKRLTEKGVTTKERLHMAKSGTIEQKIGAVRAMISEFESDDLLDPKHLGANKLAEIYQEAKKVNLHKDIEAAFPHLYKKFRQNELKGLTGSAKIEKEKEINKDFDSLFKRYAIKPDLIKHINKGAYETEDEDMRDRLRKAIEGNLNQALGPASPETRNTITSMYQQIIDRAGGGENGFRELAQKHRVAVRYFTIGPGARNLGLFLDSGGISEDKEREILREKLQPTPPAAAAAAATPATRPQAHKTRQEIDARLRQINRELKEIQKKTRPITERPNLLREKRELENERSKLK